MIKENESKIESLERKFDEIDNKLDIIIKILDTDLKKNCKKMGEHIDFVENVYDNVKNPLGFLCNKINYFSKNNDKYTLFNINMCITVLLPCGIKYMHPSLKKYLPDVQLWTTLPICLSWVESIVQRLYSPDPSLLRLLHPLLLDHRHHL